MNASNKKKILFLHGLESRPGGKKPTFLKEKGYLVLNPGLPKSSFEESVRIAQKAVDDESPDVIVGSSRGGAVAMCLKPRGAKIVLIAPGWTRFGVDIHEGKLTAESAIIHSESDDIVDFEDSVKLANQTGYPLIKVGADHRMNDSDALEGILEAVEWLTN